MPPRSAMGRTRTWMIGASVAGPRHQREGSRNQDAWHAVRRRHGTAVVVADGVGSARFAAEGSRLACKAAVSVFSALNSSVSPEEIALSVSKEWRSRLGGGKPADFATTFLFAFRFSTGRLLVGGVGDGLVAVSGGSTDVPYRTVDRPGGEFGETYSLSSSLGVHNWRITEFDDAGGGHRVFLSTDGVSNDLLEHRILALTDWFRTRFEGSSCRVWRTGVRDLLLNWPTPGSTDDKTIAMMWRSHRGDR